MTPEQFARLKQLFTDAQDLPEADRAALVASALAEDVEVGGELLRMLERRGASEIDVVEAAVAGESAEATADTSAANRSAGASLVGQTLGHIRVDELIGHGGMGAVYRGFDERLERPVAIKTILPERRLSPEARGRFLREARLLSRLDHPGICRVYDLVESPHGDCLILELLSGDTLRAVVAGKSHMTLDDDLRLAIASEITQALVAAHEKGIVHRDLKPENVMILGRGGFGVETDAGFGVKVLDFGLARTTTVESMGLQPDQSIDSLVETQRLDAGSERDGKRRSVRRVAGSADATFTAAGSVSGTVRYMSPEQARGESLTVKSDIYSLGIVLQELWTGESPYDLSRPASLLARVAEGEARPAVGIPRDLATLFSRLLALSPADRPGASEVLDALREHREGPIRRRRAVTRAAMGTLFVTLSLALAWIVGNRSDGELLLAEGQSGRILLLPFSNATEDPELDWVERGLWAMTLRILDDTEGIEAVASESVDQILDGRDSAGLELLDRTELGRLANAVGADVVQRSVLRGSEAALVLETTSLNRNGSRREWRIRGSDPVEIVRALGAETVRRVRPDATFSDLFDRYSVDPLVNRLLATGIHEARTDGASDALHYFEVTLDLEPDLELARAHLANTHLELSEFSLAQELAERVRESARLTEDATLELEALGVLSTVAFQRGDPDRSGQLAELALEISRRIEHREFEATSLARLGDVARELDDFETAEQRLREALQLRRALGDLQGVAHTLHVLGVLEEERGNGKLAEELLLEALELEEREGFLYLQAMTQNSLGILYEGVDRARAPAAFERSLELYEEVGARQQAVHALSNYSVYWQGEGDLERAYELNVRGRELAAEIDSQRTEGLLTFNGAYLALLLGRIEEAEELLVKAGAFYGNDDPDVLIVSALVAEARGDLKLAIALARRARELTETWDEERQGLLERFEKASAR